ncbi:hypothetical protein THRCLA_10688 [Thraustotheca clavata]|uniref:Uncharacterized protein n=1 Tax=Thraustotheca clavata TaxID=74557 RepID=A0A1V9YIJ9_9STRA|nr:hypothetical protein THRCLA_10688 [Thraustotheca clavata]
MLHPPTSSRKMDTLLEVLSSNDIISQKKATLHPIEQPPSPLDARASYFDSVRTSDLLTCARQIPLLEDGIVASPKSKPRGTPSGRNTTPYISEEQELPTDALPLSRLTDQRKPLRMTPLDNLMSPYSIGSSDSSDSAMSDNGDEAVMSRSFSWNKYALS